MPDQSCLSEQRKVRRPSEGCKDGCEEGEAEQRVIDHVVATAFRRTQLDYVLREGTTLRSALPRLRNFIEPQNDRDPGSCSR